MSEADSRPKRQPTGNYDVGYCRPPKETQWKPGESGRRTGRRPKQKPPSDIIVALRAEVCRKVTPKGSCGGGGMNMVSYMAKHLLADFANSTPSHRLKILKVLLELGVLQPSADDQQDKGDAIAAFVEALAEEARKEGLYP